MSRTSITELGHDYDDAVVCRNGVRRAATLDKDGVWDLGGGFEVKGRDVISHLWLLASRERVLPYQGLPDFIGVFHEAQSAWSLFSSTTAFAPYGDPACEPY
jgi:hypothetical protein